MVLAGGVFKACPSLTGALERAPRPAGAPSSRPCRWSRRRARWPWPWTSLRAMSSAKRLIVNADDLGRTPGINRGHLRGAPQGRRHQRHPDGELRRGRGGGGAGPADARAGHRPARRAHRRPAHPRRRRRSRAWSTPQGTPAAPSPRAWRGARPSTCWPRRARSSSASASSWAASPRTSTATTTRTGCRRCSTRWSRWPGRRACPCATPRPRTRRAAAARGHPHHRPLRGGRSTTRASRSRTCWRILDALPAGHHGAHVPPRRAWTTSCAGPAATRTVRERELEVLTDREVRQALQAGWASRPDPLRRRCGRLRVLDDAAAVARAAADAVAAAAAAEPELVLALPTGRTPVPLYDELARRHREGALDLSRARGFNLDELVLPRDDPRTLPLLHGAPRLGTHRAGPRALRHPGRAGPRPLRRVPPLRGRPRGGGRDRPGCPRPGHRRPRGLQPAGTGRRCRPTWCACPTGWPPRWACRPRRGRCGR